VYKGSCLCGNINFELSEELGEFGYCHCTSCRKEAAPRTQRMPQSVAGTSTCVVAPTLFGNSSHRLESFARFALAVVAQFMPICQLRRICCEYGLGVSIPLLPSSRRRTRLCPIRLPGSRSPTAFRSSIPGRPKTSCVRSDLVRNSDVLFGRVGEELIRELHRWQEG
jgi:hypothetical protein